MKKNLTYTIDPKKAKEFSQNLLNWYDQNKRELPWRKSQEPYSIWISEVMAQQTRISALLPYYIRFMEKFPTVEALAKATQDEVLKAWEGLGYYSRARNLQGSALKMMTEYNGQVPSTEKELLHLPGIGKYTAGAILSIAFNKPYAAVDGNVLRVFSRVENSRMDIGREDTKDVAARFVDAIMPKERISSFTQALMELGALVCLPKNPHCAECPVAGLCEANKNNCQSDLPIKSAKKPPKHVSKTVLLICNQKGQILMRKRTEKLLNGLWEYYIMDEINQRNIEEYLHELEYTVRSIIPIGQAKHIFTHMIWHIDGFCCIVEEEHTPKSYTFFDIQKVSELAIPTAFEFYSSWLRMSNMYNFRIK